MMWRCCLASMLCCLFAAGCFGDDSDSEPVCTAQEKKCDGDDVVKCKADGTDWEFFKTCEDGCEGGQCKAPPCAPACDGKVCGPDGCGGTCGECTAPAECSQGVCTAPCTPDCTGKVCGSNGCGGSCGECADADETCFLGECVSELPEGPCQAGESAGHEWVMVDDNPDNSTLSECSLNPGADIDAVCIYRQDELVGCATDVAYAPSDPSPCDESGADNPEEVLGIPDGVADQNEFSGYFSLNGGWIVVAFGAGVEILCGDVVQVAAMYNPMDPAAPMEQYRTSLGTGSDCFSGIDCMWGPESDWVAGESETDVSWEW